MKECIPLAYGDSYKGYRIVGTSRSYVTHYKASLEEGGFWRNEYEVTAGAVVAKNLGLKIGDTFHSAHGLVENAPAHDHADYKVVGIFEHSNSVIDQLLLTDVTSVWAIHEEPKTVDGGRRTAEGGRQTVDSEHNHDSHESHDHNSHESHDHDSHESHDHDSHENHDHDLHENHDHDLHENHDHNPNSRPPKHPNTQTLKNNGISKLIPSAETLEGEGIDCYVGEIQKQNGSDDRSTNGQ